MALIFGLCLEFRLVYIVCGLGLFWLNWLRFRFTEWVSSLYGFDVFLYALSVLFLGMFHGDLLCVGIMGIL